MGGFVIGYYLVTTLFAAVNGVLVGWAIIVPFTPVINATEYGELPDMDAFTGNDNTILEQVLEIPT